ncbi:hypothetical protein ACIQ7Q_01440 [Streptomyces sp. NPDC096176]|uniref:hypothetical protein n=1 Tax=Streptomyces sp. NPDC096176 TaxID=3366079 RepID=UPI0038244D3C
MPYESRLELARIVLADFAQDVAEIAAQPFQVCGDDGAGIRRHVPDLLLTHADGLVTVADIKAPYRVDVPEVAAQFDGLCGGRRGVRGAGADEESAGQLWQPASARQAKAPFGWMPPAPDRLRPSEFG